MKRSMFVTPVALMFALGIVGCGNGEAGQPQPAGDGNAAASTTAPSSASDAGDDPGGATGSPLRSTDPCSLLAQTAVGQLQLTPGQPSQEAVGGSRACEYEGQGYGANVVIYDSVSVENNVEAQSKPVTINDSNRKALQRETGLGNCAIGMAVTASSSVDVIATAEGETARACQLAGLVARAVEPNLPKN